MRVQALVAALALVTLAGCSIDAQQRARTTEASEVPFGLAMEEPRPPADDGPVPAASVVRIYFVGDDEMLRAVDRRVDAAEIDEVVASLLDGPTPEEARAGIASALLDQTIIESATLSGGIVAVELAPAFLDGPADSRRALAQIVYTMTGLPGVGRVSFTIGGEAIEVPRGDGTLTTGSVSRDSYRSFATR